MSTLGKTLLLGTALGIGYVVMQSRRAHAASRSRANAEHPNAETSDKADASTAASAQGSATSSTDAERSAEAPADASSATPASEPVIVRVPWGDLRAWPKTPLAEPMHANRDQYITRSSRTETVRESPSELLAQARKHDPAITLDELTGARLAASEHGSGSFTELACIIDSELNRAKRRGMSLYVSLAYQDTYGAQNLDRVASTRQDPQMRHLLAARAVLSGLARGVSRGAERFFDARSMEEQHRAYREWLASGRKGEKPTPVSCDALTLLEIWCFDYGKKTRGGNRCPPDRSRTGKHTQAWIGHIPGVNASRLMLMQPMKLGPEHTRMYEAARDYLRQVLGKE